MMNVFDVLQHVEIVHADIKPDNILVSFSEGKIVDLKLIDFGSAFSFSDPSRISMSTPEYLSPEVLEYIENRNAANTQKLVSGMHPWSFDMWSLGAILLEVLTGFPLWLSLKGRLEKSDRDVIGMGMLRVPGRSNAKIIQKQKATLRNLDATLRKFDSWNLCRNPEFMDLLKQMLDFNPQKRISPADALEHPFLI